MMKRSVEDEGPLQFELSRSIKENHGERILKVAVPLLDSSFRNVVAVLSCSQVNIYDTDVLEQGHCDLIAHYSSLPSNCYFVDCCWLKNESDGYLALLLSSGVVELLSLSYSAIISSITCPESIKLTKIFADPLDGERIFGSDKDGESVHLFSYDSAAESPLLLSESLSASKLVYCADGKLLLIDKAQRRMIPFVPEDEESCLELVDGRIAFASSRSDDFFIINDAGNVYFCNSEESLKVPSKAWSRQVLTAFDGSDLLSFVTSDQRICLFDFSNGKCSAAEIGAKTCFTAMAFITESNCCSQGVVRRLLVGDDCGYLSIYRIVR